MALDMGRHGWIMKHLAVAMMLLLPAAAAAQSIEGRWKLMAAEDLNLASAISDWVWDDSQRSMPPKTSEAIQKV